MCKTYQLLFSLNRVSFLTLSCHASSWTRQNVHLILVGTPSPFKSHTRNPEGLLAVKTTRKSLLISRLLRYRWHHSVMLTLGSLGFGRCLWWVGALRGASPLGTSRVISSGGRASCMVAMWLCHFTGPWTQKSSEFVLMLCGSSWHLDETAMFHFALDPPNYIADPAVGLKSPPPLLLTFSSTACSLFRSTTLRRTSLSDCLLPSVHSSFLESGGHVIFSMAVGIYKKIARTADFSGTFCLPSCKNPWGKEHMRDWVLLEMRKRQNKYVGRKMTLLICQ